MGLGIVNFEPYLLEQRAWPKPQTTYKVHNTEGWGVLRRLCTLNITSFIERKPLDAVKGAVWLEFSGVLSLTMRKKSFK